MKDKAYCNCKHPTYLRYHEVELDAEGRCDLCGHEVVWTSRFERYPRGDINKGYNTMHGFRPILEHANNWFALGLNIDTRNKVKNWHYREERDWKEIYRKRKES